MLNQNLDLTISWEEVASGLHRDASDTDRLMAAVCYRFEIEQVETTDISTITDHYFRRARWPRPTNLPATANHCAAKGWWAEAGKSDGRKLWRITRKGYEYIKAQLAELA